jgi:hypothetical protein
MEHFLSLYEGVEPDDDQRLKLVKMLEPLRDVALFRQLRTMDPEHYKEIEHLIWALGRHVDRYPAFKAFSWELWAYGFDGQRHDEVDEGIDEQLRLIDLLLSTQYWWDKDPYGC